MEGLDLLKQDWKKQDASLPKYAQKDLYEMLFRKSSSMVKWIFYISVIEFIFWVGLSIVFAIFDKDNTMNKPEFQVFNWISNGIFYIVILYFMVIFYKNYKGINSNDSVKGLMGSILKTRRTVKHYVWFNLIFFTVSYIAVSYIMYANAAFETANANVSPLMLFATLAIVLVVILVVLLLFYRLVYGILTRRLKKNYTELAKIEV